MSHFDLNVVLIMTPQRARRSCAASNQDALLLGQQEESWGQEDIQAQLGKHGVSASWLLKN